jgi:hypothetical protein
VVEAHNVGSLLLLLGARAHRYNMLIWGPLAKELGPEGVARFGARPTKLSHTLLKMSVVGLRLESMESVVTHADEQHPTGREVTVRTCSFTLDQKPTASNNRAGGDAQCMSKMTDENTLHQVFYWNTPDGKFARVDKRWTAGWCGIECVMTASVGDKHVAGVMMRLVRECC